MWAEICAVHPELIQLLISPQNSQVHLRSMIHIFFYLHFIDLTCNLLDRVRLLRSSCCGAVHAVTSHGMFNSTWDVLCWHVSPIKGQGLAAAVLHTVKVVDWLWQTASPAQEIILSFERSAGDKIALIFQSIDTLVNVFFNTYSSNTWRPLSAVGSRKTFHT